MSSSRDSYLRLGRWSRFRARIRYPQDSVSTAKCPHPHLSVIFALVIDNGPVQVRGKCQGAGVRERNGKSCKKPQSDKRTSRDLAIFVYEHHVDVGLLLP